MKKKVMTLMAGMVILLMTFLPAFAAEDIDITDEAYCTDVLAGLSDTPAVAEAPEDRLDLENSFLLFDFFDEPVAIFYQLKPAGFAIYDFSAGKVLEYTTEQNHPYYVEPSQRYYYGGVMEYYEKEGGSFRHLATGRKNEVRRSAGFQLVIVLALVFGGLWVLWGQLRRRHRPFRK